MRGTTTGQYNNMIEIDIYIQTSTTMNDDEFVGEKKIYYGHENNTGAISTHIYYLSQHVE